MSDLNKDLESLVGDMGLSVSDQAPNELAQPAEQTQETPVESAPEAVQEPVQEVQQTQEPEQVLQQTEAAVEQPQSSLQEDDDVSEEEMEAAMLDYLSERLGRKVSSFDEIQETQNTSVQLDERVESLNRFIQDTGRSVEDWLAYQSLNPSEMDDLTVIKAQLRNQYGNEATNEDIELLIQNKYSLDEDIYEESEIRLAQLQLKVDADKARQEIEGLRSQYTVPAKQQTQPTEEFQGIVNEEWLGTMSAEVDALDGIEFAVSKDSSFTFGLEDSYKSELKSKNENIEDFFSSYVSEEGQWDFEKWNMHQAVLDNIETIVKAAYQQGLGEGQRGLVNKAANVQYQPNQVANTGQSNVPSVEEQVRQALGLNDNGLTFKI